jgi:hypothetical protein
MKSMKVLGAVASAFVVLAAGTTSAFAGTLYSDVQTGDVNGGPETTSWAGAANGITSFGNVINVAAGTASSATVFLSNYATQADWAGSGGTYNANLTFNLFQVTAPGVFGPDTTVVTAPLVATVTQDNVINYRPDASLQPSTVPSTLNCGQDNGVALGAYWDATAGQYSCGQLNTATFNLGNLGLAAGNYVWSLDMNPTSSDPAMAALNWALNNFTDGTSISAASNPAYDVAYENYIPTTGWANIGQGELYITESSGVPEPATFGLIGLGLLGIGVSVRKKSGKA